MPYIKQEVRARIDAGGALYTSGELVYALTKMVLNYLPSNPRFVHLNEVIGALEMTKAEILRRVIAPYEAEKCILNGDVYDLTNKS